MIYHRLISQPSASLESAVLLDTPLGYWKCDETSGAVLNDSSGNNRNGVINSSNPNVVLGAASLRDGSTGSLSTTSLTDKAATIDVGAFKTTGIVWTMECIANITGRGIICGMVLDADQGAFSDEGAPCIYQRGGVWGAQTNHSNDVSSSVDDDVAAHIVFVRDNDTYYYYVNGALEDTVTPDIKDVIQDTLYLLGANAFAGSYGSIGRVSDVALYDYALSTNRVLIHAQYAGYS